MSENKKSDLRDEMKITQTAQIVVLTDEERKQLMEKVEKKLEGKLVAMTEEEIDAFYDTRGF